jgi:hypothetical protein
MLLDLLVGMHCSRWAVPGSVRICPPVGTDSIGLPPLIELEHREQGCCQSCEADVTNLEVICDLVSIPLRL